MSSVGNKKIIDKHKFVDNKKITDKHKFIGNLIFFVVSVKEIIADLDKLCLTSTTLNKEVVYGTHDFHAESDQC